MSFSIDDQLIRFQIRVAWVVDVSGFVPVESSVDDVLVVQGEHVAVIVGLLTFITDWVSNLLAHILYYNILRVKPAQLL